MNRLSQSNYFSCWALLLTLSSIAPQVNAQQRLHGVIRDVETLGEVSFAHVLSARHGAVSNTEGEFSLPYESGDTLFITHVNYAQLIVVPDVSEADSLEFFLTPHDWLLNEITIYNLPSEENLKRRIKATAIRPDMLEENATENMQNAKRIVLAGYSPVMNSMDNFNYYVQEPQGVSIFSSDPSKGLLKALNNLSRYQKPFSYTRPIQPIPANQLWKYYKAPSIVKE